MLDFEALCALAEEMSEAERLSVLREKAAAVIPALGRLSGNGENGVDLFSTFLFGAMAADGRLSPEEYEILKPFLYDFFGTELGYERCRDSVEAFQSGRLKLEETADETADAVGALDPQLKNDVVLCSLILCSVDGKVTSTEKRYLKRLIA